MPTLFEIGEANHGVVTSSDLRATGTTDWAVRRLLASGQLVRVLPGLYRLGGAPRTEQQALVLALAEHGEGAHLAQRSAAALWGIPGYRHLDRPDVVVVEEAERRSRLSRLHSTSLLLPAHRSVRAGLAVTSPARTLFDLAGVDPPGRVERAADHLLVRRLVTMAQLEAALSALGGRGRSGTVAFRQILEDRGAGYVAPASELERVARRVFHDAGLPEPRFEVDLGDGSWIARVDCLWPAPKLVVELDGRRFHDGRAALEDDRRRDNRLMAQGWRVLRFTWDDLQRRPAEVVATIRSALEIAA